MELREPKASDTERVRELVESTMTASYALSPQQIEAVLAENFSEEQLGEAFEDSVTLVAESTVNGGEPTVAGIVKGERTGDEGEVRWLFVDPEHRGKGIGTELFETAVESLREQGAEGVRASTLEANREGSQFAEQFGLSRTDERSIEIDGESLVEYVYTESSADAESESADEYDGDLPNTESENGHTTATTDDGQQVYIDREERDSGTEAPFFTAYTDEEFTDQFGYYCANCGSLDTTMDDMGRVECSECSNVHAERSEEAYDDSYL
ncbi:MAG TPA: GNAT family N-acetyltransferase [Halococcus sp.]|nr:GNAT family N-acetyltransferase [Halococcus sp.]